MKARKLVPKDVYDRTLNSSEIDEAIKLFEDKLNERKRAVESAQKPYDEALYEFELAQAMLKQAGADLDKARIELQRTQVTLEKLQRIKLNERGGLLFHKEAEDATRTDKPKEKGKYFHWQAKAVESLTKYGKFMDPEKLFSHILHQNSAPKQSYESKNDIGKTAMKEKFKKTIIDTASREYKRKDAPVVYYQGLIGLPDWLDAHGVPKAGYIAFTGGSPMMKVS